jgi:hypothetical protein
VTPGSPSSCRRERLDPVECVGKPVAFDLEVVAALQVQPEAVRRTEEARQRKGRGGADAAPAVDDLVDASWRDAYRDGEPVLGDAQRLEELAEADPPPGR